MEAPAGTLRILNARAEPAIRSIVRTGQIDVDSPRREVSAMSPALWSCATTDILDCQRSTRSLPKLGPQKYRRIRSCVNDDQRVTLGRGEWKAFSRWKAGSALGARAAAAVCDAGRQAAQASAWEQ